MKKITFILLALLSGTAFGQNKSATANAAADIVSPINIEKKTDLHFGKVIPDATGGTIIVLNQNGTINEGSTTGVSVTTSTKSAASFEITATDTYTYSVTIPTSITLNGTGTAMDVTLDPNLTATGNVSDGTPATLLVGGTLNVGMNQTAGNYSTTFDVTVAYE